MKNRTALLAALILAGTEAGAQTPVSVPSIFFSDDRTFQLGTERLAYSLNVSQPQVAYVYESALGSCGSSGGELENRLTSALGEYGPVATILDAVAPHWREVLVQRRVLLVVDDFGPRREVFTSFYARAVGPDTLRILALDCARENRREWPALLVHEITHALFEGAGYPAWLEEGLAQWLEQQAGGTHPERSLRAARSELRRASFRLETTGPLSSSAAYARSFLAVRYLFAERGGYTWVRRLLAREASSSDLEASPAELREMVRNSVD